jgi:RNA-directed DNA polymerase
VTRVKEKIRDLTKRSQSMTMKERIGRLNSYLGGWMGYFALADAKNLLQGLDEWLRRRLRQILWKEWKRTSARYRNLRRLGLKEKQAREIAGADGTYWRTAKTPHLHKALGLAYWRAQGLVGMVDRYEKIRGA